MDVSALSALLSPTDGAAAPSGRRDAIDQGEFMTLLVTQLQNQDPLNPLDSTQFAAQLAQFASLEQLTQINRGIEQLSNGADAPALGDAVALLGREVTARVDTLAVSGGVAAPLELRLDAPAEVTVELRSESGALAGTVLLGRLDAGAQVVDLGAFPGGESLPDGSYSLRIQAVEPGGGTREIEGSVRGIVTDVQLEDGAPVLSVGPQRVRVQDVRAIRAPA